MDDFETKVHHAWTQFLVAMDDRIAAGIAVESEVSIIEQDNFGIQSIMIGVPVKMFGYVTNDDDLSFTLRDSLARVLDGQWYSEYEGILSFEQAVNLLRFHMILSEPSPDWINTVRKLIAAPSDSNQGIVTELVFGRKGRDVILYNEMKFASQTEVRIAQELEQRGVLFFPLPLAVRTVTNKRYEDHREPDFVICVDGKWGILEVSGGAHAGRYDKDDEKARWFKQAGIQCLEHFSAERCREKPREVVDEFLAILERQK